MIFPPGRWLHTVSDWQIRAGWVRRESALLCASPARTVLHKPFSVILTAARRDSWSIFQRRKWSFEEMKQLALRQEAHGPVELQVRWSDSRVHALCHAAVSSCQRVRCFLENPLTNACTEFYILTIIIKWCVFYSTRSILLYRMMSSHGMGNYFDHAGSGW